MGRREGCSTDARQWFGEQSPTHIENLIEQKLDDGTLLPLTISHLTADQDPDCVARLVEASQDTTRPLYPRTSAEVRAVLVGCGQLVPPGVVPSPQWRPDESDDPAAWLNLAAVACRD